jgi:hypothetical protein
VAVEVEMVVHLHALEATLGVILGQLGKNVYLQLGGVPVFLDIPNDFYSNSLVLFHIMALDHFAESSFS